MLLYRHVFCRSYPTSNLYEVSFLKSGMKTKRVRKIKLVAKKIRSFVKYI